MKEWEVLATIKHLPKSLSVDLNHPQVSKYDDAPEEILSHEQSKDHRLKYILRDPKGRHFILEKYGKSFWASWKVITLDYDDVHSEQSQDKSASDKNDTTREWNQLQLRDLLSLWIDRKSFHLPDKPIQLNMQVPRKLRPGNSRHDGNSIDPKTYLETKYYESLFFLNSPFAYFVKSYLSRLKNMCTVLPSEEGTEAYRSTLLKMLLGIKAFDERHEDNALLKNELENTIASARRDASLNKYNSLGDENRQNTFYKDLSTIFKAREIKLQVIILLETIYLEDLDSQFKDYESRYQLRLKRRSMNVTKMRVLPARSRKKKSTPHDELEKESAIDHCELLDLYLDKLCILDILLASEPSKPSADENVLQEHKKNMLNKNKETSSIGFTNYVLIPYFSRKVPNTVRFIIHKLKGPNLRSKKLSEKRNTPFVPTGSLADNDDMIDTKYSSQSSSKFSSTPASPQAKISSVSLKNDATGTLTPELLNSRINPNLNVFFEANMSYLKKPSFISRTSSDLTMNHLQKRQLSVTEFASQKLTLAEKTQPAKFQGCIPAKESSQFQQSFRRVGKRKNNEETIERSHSCVMDCDQKDNIQVIGTPLVKKREDSLRKREHLHNIVESPVGSNSLPAEVEKDSSQDGLVSEATTAKKLTSKRNIRRRLFAP